SLIRSCTLVAMTTRDMPPPSRGTNVRVMHLFVALEDEEGAGNAGCRPHPWPACDKESSGQSPQVQPEHPAFPARWFYGLYVRSPESGLVSLRRPWIITRDLIPASGGLDSESSPL